MPRVKVFVKFFLKRVGERGTTPFYWYSFIIKSVLKLYILDTMATERILQNSGAVRICVFKIINIMKNEKEAKKKK